MRGAVAFVDEGARWRIGALPCDGFLPFAEGRAWFNVGGRRAFEARESPSDAYRGAVIGGTWGLVDDEARVLIEPRYDGAMGFGDDRAWANVGGAMQASHGWMGYWCEGGLWALIDRDGRERVAPTFTRVRAFRDGIAWARVERWGLVGRDGAWRIQPRFDDVPWRSHEIPAFVDDVEPVALDGHWGLIDRFGAWRVRPRFDHIYDLREGIARVAIWLDDPDPQDQVGRSGLYGFLDASGRVIHEPAFSRATDFSDGRAEVVLEGRAAVIDRDGRLTFA